MRCPSCDRSCRFVQPTGPVPCSTLFIGEKPGREEASRGYVFAGDTGKELDGLYLPLAGLDREDVRITNTVKCRLGDSNDKPTPEQVRSCALHHLPGEIAECRPKVIVLLGATACSLVPKVELDKDHGIPVRVEAGEVEYFGQWSGWVWPSYHPASALHDTGMMIPLLDDFERLRKWRRGKWRPPYEQRNESVDYAVADRASVIREFSALKRYAGLILPVDTENDGPAPWSVQYSLGVGNGRLIPVADSATLKAFREAIHDWRFTLVFHNAAHDLDTLQRLTIEVPQFRDTMQEAYHLGNLPQGLKALAWRLLGIRMRSWEDVVLPHSREKMIAWLMDKWNDEGENRIRVEHPYKKPRKVNGQLVAARVEFKPNERERALKRILSHSHKPEYDLWEKVAEVDGLSGWPVKSIAHVPLDEAVRYGCMDADITGQVAMELERLRGELVKGEWNIPEGDRDR